MIGKPKYNYNDEVKFTIDNKEYKGKIYIIDPYGTFEDNSDVSYDIMVQDFGEKHEECLFKHISEKLIRI